MGVELADELELVACAVEVVLEAGGKGIVDESIAESAALGEGSFDVKGAADVFEAHGKASFQFEVFSFKNTEEEFTAKALRGAEERRRRVIGYKLEVIGEEEEEEVNIEHPTLNIEVEEGAVQYIGNTIGSEHR